MDYDSFRKEYIKQHPNRVPVLELAMNEYPRWVRWAVLAMFISAALVSGVHTVPTVWESIEVGEIVTPLVRNIVSVGALVAVEFSILLSAHLMTKKWFTIAHLVAIIGIGIAVAANLYKVVEAFSTGSAWAQAVAAALGVGAPLIALFAGKMFVDMHRANRVQEAIARKKNREDWIAFDKECLSAYNVLCKKAGVDPLTGAVHASNGQSIGQSTSAAASTIGHRKTPDATKVVEQYLTDNPAAIDTPPRLLAEQLGVGKSTVNNVQRRIRGQGAVNGRSESDSFTDTVH